MAPSSKIAIFVGEEEFLIEREVARLKKEFLDPASIDFNFDKFVAGENSMNAILDTCSMMPMMAENRVVIVSKAQEWTKDDLALLASYWESPNPSTCLIIRTSKIDKRLKAWAAASQKGWIREFKPLYDNQVVPWIVQEAKHRGLFLGSSVAMALADNMGNSLLLLSQALEQLELMVAPKKEIALADVEALIGDFLSKNIFDFVDCVGQKKTAQAMALLDQMLIKGEAPVKILTLIHRHFRLLLLGQECSQKRMNDKESAQMMGVSPFFVRNYLEQARQWSLSKIKRAYHSLVECDFALKSSPLDSRLILDSFLLSVFTS